MSTAPSRPNYFDLLDIKPDSPWNEADFQATLMKKKAEWTKKKGNPKNAKMYQGYLEMVPKIEALMKDEALRKAEAEEAKKLLKEKDREGQVKFKADLDLVSSKGFLTEPEIATLVKNHGATMTEDKIRAEIKARKIEIRTASSSSTSADKLDVLDNSQMDRISSNLKEINKGDLYDFLGLSPSTSLTALAEAASAIYNENQKQGAKTNKVTASSELAGEAKIIFADKTSRDKYDNALKMRVYEEIDDDVRKLLQGSDKKIYAAQFSMIVEKARGKKLDLDTVEHRIRTIVSEMKAVLEVVDLKTVKEQRLCPNCGTLNAVTNKNCKTCGTPLVIICPDCKHEILTENTACTDCGFPIGNLSLVSDFVKEIIELLSQNKVSEAILRLEAAQQIWGGDRGKTFNDDLSRQIQTLLTESKNRQKALLERISKLKNTIDSKRFYSARDMLRQIEVEQGANILNAERRQIEVAIQRAEQQVKQAQAIQSPDEMVQAYLQILQDCADCIPAQQALAKTPPTAPQELKAEASAEVVSLHWQPSPSRGVRYTVIRKSKSSPVSVNDGLRLDTVNGLRFDDTKPEIGLPVYYAVYADREGIVSNESALLNTPVLIVRGIAPASLTARVDNQQVHLTWQTPPNVTQVQVVRSDTQMPRTLTDGVSVPILDKSQVVDTNLNNEKTYYYGVFCIFTDHQGKTVVSPGAFIDATPEQPPTPITEMGADSIQSTPEHIVRLSWPEPQKGRVVLLQNNQAPQFGHDNVITESQLESRGKVLHPHGNMLEATVDSARITYFTPVVLFQKMAYIGKTLDYASLDDVSDLKLQNQKVELQLRWEWPKNCHKVIVAYSNTDFPSTHNDDLTDVVRTEMTKSQYQSRGYYAIKSPAKRDYYIAVLAVITQEGQELIASGHSKGARAKVSLLNSMAVTYEVTRTRKLIGKGALTLTIQITGDGMLPDLILVAKQGTLPIKKTDGEIVFRLSERALTAPTTTITEVLDSSIERPQRFVRFFLDDDRFYDNQGGHIRISHPDQQRLRLF